MRKLKLLLAWSLLIASATIATAVAAAGSDKRSAPSGPAGRAYVANEATGSVSVIDTDTNAVIDTICLGSDPAIAGTPQPDGPCNAETQHHAALYNGHVDTHGLWLTPDKRVLLVANRISGTIVAVDTATRKVLGYLPVGREPHLATVRPGKAEAWAAIRGENYVEVIKIDRDDLFDSTKLRTDRMESVAKLRSAFGPSMVSFTSDGTFAFVAAGKEARVDKFDADTRKIVASRTVVAKFTPFGLVTPDDQELYLVHKGAGMLTILHTSDLSPVVEGLPIGARANHVFFLGKLAYITIGGPAPSATNADPEGKIVIVDRTTHAIVNELTGPAFTGEPHGIWGTRERTLYIGHERGNRVTVLDVNDPNNAFDDEIAGTVTDSFLKKPIDIVVAP
jgi:YVTN family beta-propeller protein